AGAGVLVVVDLAEASGVAVGDRAGGHGRRGRRCGGGVVGLGVSRGGHGDRPRADRAGGGVEGDVVVGAVVAVMHGVAGDLQGAVAGAERVLGLERLHQPVDRVAALQLTGAHGRGRARALRRVIGPAVADGIEVQLCDVDGPVCRIDEGDVVVVAVVAVVDG